MPPPEKPLLRPRSKPRPKLKVGPSEAKSLPARPARDGTPGGVPVLPQPLSCEASRLCPPPPSPPATVHLRSGRLPTPLIAVSASLLALSAVLLLALLVRWLLRRRRVERYAPQEAPLAPDVDEEESVMGVDSVEAGSVAGQEEDEEDVDGEVHHVWFIRTKGLDERAIAAIAAVVYDAKTKRGVDADGGCAVCLAEFRDGETLRLLPRCAHAFHRGCIDTWLRAHVNCPLCRAPVQVPTSTATVTRPRGEAPANPIPTLGGAQAEEAVLQERAVRRAASMLTLPRREWPDDVSLGAPASASGREEDMTGLAKIRRLLKFSEALDGVAAGRSFSFGASRSCQRVPARPGPSTAASADGDDVESSR